MSARDPHTDPFGAAFSQLAGHIARQVAEENREHIAAAVAQARKDAYADAVTASSNLQLFRLYSTQEVADLLGMDAADVSRISPLELPKRKKGLNRGRNGYLGIDLLCYLLGREPVDLNAVVDRAAADLRAPLAPAVRSLRADKPGKTRVL